MLENYAILRHCEESGVISVATWCHNNTERLEVFAVEKQQVPQKNWLLIILWPVMFEGFCWRCGGTFLKSSSFGHQNRTVAEVISHPTTYMSYPSTVFATIRLCHSFWKVSIFSWLAHGVSLCFPSANLTGDSGFDFALAAHLRFNGCTDWWFCKHHGKFRINKFLILDSH